MVAGSGSQDRIEFWVTTGLQAITIIVLVFFWFAAWKQGRAADKLARATRAQTDANRRIAAATDAQNEIARVQMEETFRPLLYLAWNTSGAAASLHIRNDGGGPALDCAWHYGKANGHRPPTQKLEYEAIASHQEVPFGLPVRKAGAEGLTIYYRSVTGTSCATEVTWQGTRFHCRYIPTVPPVEDHYDDHDYEPEQASPTTEPAPSEPSSAHPSDPASTEQAQPPSPDPGR